jgi:hypothetical protein
MNIILVSGTGASGSSAIFDYINCFSNISSIETELKPIIRNQIYSDWVNLNYKYKASFKSRMRLFLNKTVTNKFGDNFKGTLLLNNSISCLNLKGIELFDNIKVCCILRDPRSTWVAWQTEWLDKNKKRKWSNYKDPVGAYILSYRQCMEKFYSEYKKLINPVNVKTFYFEDFVLEASYQKRLENFLNLKDSFIEPIKSLRPYDKTIFAHKNYSNQTIISRIFNELNDYCHPGV